MRSFRSVIAAMIPALYMIAVVDGLGNEMKADVVWRWGKLMKSKEGRMQTVRLLRETKNRYKKNADQ